MAKRKADSGARVGFTPCPDFDLEPAIKLDRELLLPVETDPEIVAQAKKLTLTLSLVFNDLRALSWAAEQLQRGKPEDQASTVYSGQWTGMSDAFARMAHGLLHELGNLIQTNSALLAWAPLKSINMRLSGGAGEAWQAVLDFAKG